MCSVSGAPCFSGRFPEVPERPLGELHGEGDPCSLAAVRMPMLPVLLDSSVFPGVYLTHAKIIDLSLWNLEEEQRQDSYTW